MTCREILTNAKEPDLDPVLEQIAPDGEDIAEAPSGAIDSALGMLSPAAAAVLSLAERLALAVGGNAICTDQLLQALADDAAPASSRVLAAAGIDKRSLAAVQQFVLGPTDGQGTATAPLPRSPRVDEILLRAEKDARKRGATQIGTLHLLHALIASRQGLAVFLLETPGHGTTALTAKITSALAAGVVDGE